jgi:hypothetical protein
MLKSVFPVRSVILAKKIRAFEIDDLGELDYDDSKAEKD